MLLESSRRLLLERTADALRAYDVFSWSMTSWMPSATDRAGSTSAAEDDFVFVPRSSEISRSPRDTPAAVVGASIMIRALFTRRATPVPRFAVGKRDLQPAGFASRRKPCA